MQIIVPYLNYPGSIFIEFEYANFLETMSKTYKKKRDFNV